MPMPRWVAVTAKHSLNHLTRPLLGRLPWSGWGVVVHIGRKSGREYRTPINVFRRPGGYLIALTYGPQSEWVRNVLASGGCVVETQGRSHRLTQPRLIHVETPPRLLPAPTRFILGRVAHVKDYLELSDADAGADTDADTDADMGTDTDAGASDDAARARRLSRRS